MCQMVQIPNFCQKSNFEGSPDYNSHAFHCSFRVSCPEKMYCALCRYDLKGFVEELVPLPESRYGHACAALPNTGVRYKTIF